MLYRLDSEVHTTMFAQKWNTTKDAVTLLAAKRCFRPHHWCLTMSFAMPFQLDLITHRVMQSWLFTMYSLSRSCRTRTIFSKYYAN